MKHARPVLLGWWRTLGCIAALGVCGLTAAHAHAHGFAQHAHKHAAEHTAEDSASEHHHPASEQRLTWAWRGETGEPPADDLEERVLLNLDFEPEHNRLPTPGYELVKDGGLDGGAGLVGEVAKPDQSRILRVPFENAKGTLLELSFHLRAKKKVHAAVWIVADGQPRERLKRVTAVPGQWSDVRVWAVPQTDRPGHFEIVAPSSWGGPTGKAWLDRLTLTAHHDPRPASRANDPPGPGEAGVVSQEEMGRRVLLRTDFERGQDRLAAPDYKVVPGAGLSGSRGLVGEVKAPEKARMLRVPFEGESGTPLELSFYVRSEANTRCGIWVVMDGQPRKQLTAIDAVPDQWTRMEASAVPQTDQRGYFEIATPNSWGAPAGRARLDRLALVEQWGKTFSLDHVQDFPAMAADGAGGAWLAVIARPLPEHEVRIFHINDDRRELVGLLEPLRATAVGRPAIVPFAGGCLVAFAVESQGRWRIAYAFIDGSGEGEAAVRLIDSAGSANVRPALAAVGDRAAVVWESNGDDNRGVYACFLSRDGHTQPRRISAPGYVSRNPDITALRDGSLFAAWDSVRSDSADLYGARYQSGSWQSERRITHHPRIERHASLAARNGRVWIAWQAQSFPGRRINHLTEQRIAVAQLSPNGLRAPRGLFEHVSPPGANLMRPEIGFDGRGRLWLTARESMGTHAGWRPLAWSYSGATWSGPHALWDRQGRWRPVTMALSQSGTGGLAAVQRDHLPTDWGTDLGVHPNWPSDVAVVPLRTEQRNAPLWPSWAVVSGAEAPRSASLKTVPLQMPSTQFRLAEHAEAYNLRQPRQHIEHGGERLTLFWGDLHEHTCMSVCSRQTNPPAQDLLANQQDIAGVDFTALTDHGYNLDEPQWAYTGDQIRANHDPGRFITLLGQEWTSTSVAPEPGEQTYRYGHRNIIFQDPAFPRFFDSRDGPIPPEQVWRQLRGEEFVMIPHQLADWMGHGRGGSPPIDWEHHHEHHQPLAEIFQNRGSYEALGAPRQADSAAPYQGHYLQDAWEKGVVIGVIASPDHGGGRGLAGVWTDEFTREALFEAFHARHTFGTSGAKIALFVRSGEHMMGDKTTRTGGSIPIHVRATTDRPIARIVILRNNEPVHVVQPSTGEARFTWTDENPPKGRLWYYVRIERADGELAWSSPIWFMPRPNAPIAAPGTMPPPVPAPPADHNPKPDGESASRRGL